MSPTARTDLWRLLFGNRSDDAMGIVGVGLDMITAQETVLHVTYDGQFGETTRIQSVALKGSVRY
ncbi:protein of unknown function [Hyphomicrobium sp. 1Nfss2.1]|uniref:hypothetical protein n=1 Tax=Hyphomicrobium sp. 1Nfss2.1 TaxID=3413936 RepID=UPI003C7EC9AC